MKNFYYPKLYLLIFFIFTSCEIIDYRAEIPSYIHIPAFELETDIANEGSSSNAICDVWVYIDGKTIGAFELPATFPVLKKGVSTIVFFAGIKLNGIGATRGVYPFYKKYEITTELFPDGIITIIPSTQYSENLQFRIIEDFEHVGVNFEATSRSDTILHTTNDSNLVFEGNRSGVAYLSAPAQLFECKSIEAFNLPKGGAFNFIEMNFKCDVSVTVGIFANEMNYSAQHPILVLNPTNEWKKIYINIGPRVSREINAIDFNIFFGMYLKEGQENATLYVDNIKLIHY